MTGTLSNSRRAYRLLLLALSAVMLMGQIAPTSPTGKSPSSGPVYIISLHGMVNDVMRNRLKRQTDEAVRSGASAIVLRMDTWGGIATSALEMSDQIKTIDVPVIAWVRPKAISAGAMISLACDRIIVADRARIGDCMPISGSGQPLGQAEREKIETVIREEFRDSGVRNGYPLSLCIAMVTRGPAVYQIEHQTDHTRRYIFATELSGYGLTGAQAAASPQREPSPPDAPDTPDPPDLQDAIRRMIAPGAPEPKTPSDEPAASTPASPDAAALQTPYDPGQWRIVRQILAENQLLTMSQDEAIHLGFAQQRINSESALAQYLGVPADSVTVLEANWSEKLVDFLTSPFVRGILTIVLLMAVYSEMQSPGLGLAAGVAVVAAAILLGAPYLAGLANMWELLIILLGVILLAVEIFITPGFGVLGFAGIALMFLGLLLTFVPSEPGPGFIPQLPGTWYALRDGFLTLLASFLIAMIGMIVLTKYFGSIPILNRLILKDTPIEPPSNDLEIIGGKGTIHPGDTGHALNDLRPAGRASFGQLSVDVVTDGQWIEAGSPITITTIAGNRVVVRKT